ASPAAGTAAIARETFGEHAAATGRILATKPSHHQLNVHRPAVLTVNNYHLRTSIVYHTDRRHFGAYLLQVSVEQPCLLFGDGVLFCAGIAFPHFRFTPTS